MSDVVQPRLGPIGWLRWSWRSLTSMRTALFLLLLLSVAAVPGSLFPQRSIDPGRVADFLATNPGTGPWLDRLSFFDVYTSPWFSAIYLLLVISLIGCIVPRSRLHWHALRSQPPRAPRRLERLEANTTVPYAGSPADALAVATAALRRRRYRVHSHDDSSVSAESGYLRETGNLVFHVALCAVIVGVAVGHLFGWRGDVVVPEGQTFVSTLRGYHTFTAGPLVDRSSVPVFAVTVDRFDVRFEEQVGGSQFGAPRGFTAYTRTSEDPGAPGDQPREQVLTVNEPLSIEGADVYLLGNGYAPVITVRDASGAVLYRQATPFLAQDNLYTSVGAVKVPSASPKMLGFSGFFLPTADPTYANGPQSTFPALKNPELALDVWEGNLFPGGRPQSVYSLTTTELTQVPRADGAPLRIRLGLGQTYELPGGRGSITFESVSRFAGLSVRTDPGKGFTLYAALLTIAGLVASLLVRRRRVFVRVDGSQLVIGGLAKNADPGLAGFVAELGVELGEALRGRGSEPVGGRGVTAGDDPGGTPG
ncbi:MAG TPA: cytochrome c biogenesis protein ResB [Dermatophilaceae bacterium]|nr:cytochrome c biogenesis protein ResB [Dermatophilaceae bacterium]